MVTIKLNDAQRVAAESPPGPVLVVAGPGTGKTAALAGRAAHLVESGTSPERVLAFTFTNQAAREMKERMEAWGVPAANARTMHSWCFRFLRRHPGLFSAGFRVLDEEDAKTLFMEAARAAGIVSPAKARRKIERLRSRGLTLRAAERKRAVDIEALEAWAAYEKTKLRNNVVDFDDLLLLAAEALEDPTVRAAEAAQYDAVLVDEFQDLNEPQYRIVKALASGRRNVFAVGDDAQAIYAWRGVDPGIFRRFLQDFPDTRVTLLEESYRCTQAILDAAGALPIGALSKRLRSTRGPGRRPAAYSAVDREEEARAVAEAAAFMLTWLLPDGLAVLTRRRQDLKGLSAAFTRAHVPHQVVGGTAFLNRAEVKLAVALLAAAAGRATDADARRLAEALIPGVGEGTLKKLAAWAAERGAPLMEAFSRAGEAGAGRAQAEALEEFSRRVSAWRTLPFGPALFNRAAEESGLLAMFEGDRERLANVVRLQEMIAAATDADEFFAGLALAAGDCVEEAGKARLMTMHSSKGREFEAVMVPGLADRLIPGDDDWVDEAEEARVLYVACTRARDALQLFWPRSVGLWRARPSRFLVRMGPFLEGGVKAVWA